VPLEGTVTQAKNPRKINLLANSIVEDGIYEKLTKRTERGTAEAESNT
jgi:ribosomal protein S17